ncbi:MAG: peptide-binding protein [Victivallaceae bacterium]|nr:peptide-binding protein [Victivallaceae bacterium]
MNKNLYLNFILTVATSAFVFLGIVLINAVDRLHQNSREVLKRLDRLEEALTARPAQTVVLSAKKNTTRVIQAFSQIANRQYFDPEAVSGGRLIGAISSDTPNMNYLINNEATAGTFNALCSSALAARDLKNPDEFEPLMAESWTISPDKLTYLITLKKGILWQDFTDPVTGKVWKNKEVTAADFKFFLDAIRNPDTNCAPLRVYYQDIDKLEIIDKYTFKVVWKTRYFRSLELTLSMSPLPRHLYHAYPGPFDPQKFNDDHQRNRLIVGCGPYRFLRWDKNRRVIFVRFEDYFGKKYGIMPPLKYRVYEIIKHPNTRFQALLAGEIDQLGLSAEQWVKRTDTPLFAKNGKIRKIKYLGHSYSYIGYNLNNPLFQDKRVRRALTQLVDRKKILREVYHDLGKIVTGPFFYNSSAYDKSVQPYAFDIEKARRLLAEAGWKDTDGDGILDQNGRKFTFTFLQISGSVTQQKIIPIIKEDMAKAGIDMKIQVLEWAVYLQRLEEKNFDVCSLGWTTAYEADPYQVWHSSQADRKHSSNHISFRNAEADRLIVAIRRTFDPVKRTELCHQFHRLIHEEQPYTFLFAPYELIAQSSRYRNVKIFPLGLETQIIWTPKKQQRKIPGI